MLFLLCLQVDFERLNNDLLISLWSSNERYKPFANVRRLIVEKQATILLPQSSSLGDVVVTTAFALAHTVVCSAANGDHFLTLNGLFGAFDEKHERVAIVGFVPDAARFTPDDARPDSPLFVALATRFNAAAASAAAGDVVKGGAATPSSSASLLSIIDTTYFEVESGGACLCACVFRFVCFCGVRALFGF